MMAVFKSGEEGRAGAHQAVAQWNDRDLDAYFAGFASDVRCDVNGLELNGVDALRAFYEAVLSAFPDLRIELAHVVVDVETQTVATMQVERGTHHGDLVTPHGTIPATGRPFVMHGAMFMRFDDDGLVCEMTELVDRTAFAELAAPA